jgi:hypothetical protein
MTLPLSAPLPRPSYAPPPAFFRASPIPAVARGPRPCSSTRRSRSSPYQAYGCGLIGVPCLGSSTRRSRSSRSCSSPARTASGAAPACASSVRPPDTWRVRDVRCCHAAARYAISRRVLASRGRVAWARPGLRHPRTPGAPLPCSLLPPRLPATRLPFQGGIPPSSPPPPPPHPHPPVAEVAASINGPCLRFLQSLTPLPPPCLAALLNGTLRDDNEFFRHEMRAVRWWWRGAEAGRGRPSLAGGGGRPGRRAGVCCRGSTAWHGCNRAAIELQ